MVNKQAVAGLARNKKLQMKLSQQKKDDLLANYRDDIMVLVQRVAFLEKRLKDYNHAHIAELWNSVHALETALKDKLVDAMVHMQPAQERGQFCVIGDKSGHQYPISRTWKGTQAEAEQYAASLVRNQSTTTELLVVKVVSKVGRKEPDIKVTRV